MSCALLQAILWFFGTSNTHTHTRSTALFQDYPGEPVQKGKTNLDFTGARDSEWQWHQLGHMQVCTSLQTDNHASTPPLSFLQAGCPSCRPTNSVKALKEISTEGNSTEGNFGTSKKKLATYFSKILRCCFWNKQHLRILEKYVANFFFGQHVYFTDPNVINGKFFHGRGKELLSENGIKSCISIIGKA